MTYHIRGQPQSAASVISLELALRALCAIGCRAGSRLLRSARPGHGEARFCAKCFWDVADVAQCTTCDAGGGRSAGPSLSSSVWMPRRPLAGVVCEKGRTSRRCPNAYHRARPSQRDRAQLGFRLVVL
jgi:hypothetical protein